MERWDDAFLAKSILALISLYFWSRVPLGIL